MDAKTFEQGDQEVKELNSLTECVIGAAIEVHRQLGPGLLESVYEACLYSELKLLGVEVQRQVALPISYKGVVLEEGMRLDLLVGRSLIVELKAVEALLPIHSAQVITYLKEAQIYSAWRAITWLGRSAALVFLQISRYLLQKPPCIPSRSKRRASTRINPRFLKLSRLSGGLLLNFNVTALRQGIKRLYASNAYKGIPPLTP